MSGNDSPKEVERNITKRSLRSYELKQGLSGSTDAESSGRSLGEQAASRAASLALGGVLPDTSAGPTKSALKKPRVEDKPRESSGYNTRSKRRKARFGEKTDEIDTYSSKEYNRKASAKHNVNSLIEDRIDDLGIVCANSEKIYKELKHKLDTDDLNKRTGIKSEKEFDELINRANRAIDLINEADEKGKGAIRNTLFEIIDEAENMQKELRELQREIRPPKRAAALRAEETTKRRSQ